MDTQKQVNFGSSLLVPSVLELAKQSPAEVPDRYIRSDHDSLTTLSGVSMTDQTIPVIDLQSLLSPEPIIGELELERLHSACKEWGFFQVVNHGVDILLVDKVKSEIESFFNLPMDEKKKFWQVEGDLEGFGQAFVHSEDQKLDWADVFFILTQPQRMRKPKLFVKLPLPLRKTIESYSLETNKLSMTLLELMGKALQIENGVMAELFEGGRQTMRMTYYPPCPQPKHVIGLTTHSDAGGVTILLQLNAVDGLQIRKEKLWVPVKPLPNAFVVNIGDILEIMSNGIYRSTELRATVNLTKERLSVAAFLSPKKGTKIGPILSMLTPETPALFRTSDYEDYFQKHFSHKLDGKLFLNSMRIGESDEGSKIIEVFPSALAHPCPC
ncbi:codeine O-demethylase-like [Papaver somniferum]|uniref:codeine O-demethylase-like n=1 Tax=Papaver somniferum TaxID=3469 RepID=UPI000E703354|nr:codeine O-demethylase-like [Papaver somniferum]